MGEDYSYNFYKTTTEAWAAMHNAILSAKKSIYWEVYIFVDDSVGNQFISLLSMKAKEGVEVKMVVDAFGSTNFSEAGEKILVESGVEILKYNRFTPRWKIGEWWSKLVYRNHRKVLIVDEETAFLGGVNVKASFKSWDDIYIKITGEVVRPLLKGFAKSYISAGGNRKKVKHLLKTFEDIRWREKINFIIHSPTLKQISKTRKFYLKALLMAQDTFNLLTPYYIPDRKFLKAVAVARKRGVKVNIFLPLRPDLKMMELLARTYYELTLKSGANIYLLPNMNHGKALSVDDKLGLVGSINMTPRSFTHQEESAVTFTDEQMVGELNDIFNNWKDSVSPLNIEKWSKRSRIERFREWVVKFFENFV